MVGITPKPAGGFIVKKGAQKKDFNINKDVVVFSRRVTDEVKLDNSDLVFVGYGVQAPEFQWDDFKGVDVKGKTIVVLVNDPPIKKADGALDDTIFGGKAMTYYGRWTYKYDKAAELGAAGVIIVHETEPAGYPFTVVQNNSNERFNLSTPDKNMGTRRDPGLDVDRRGDGDVQDGRAGLPETEGAGGRRATSSRCRSA